jgi:hypothetical protein
MSRVQNVTMIEDLPELDEVESFGGGEAKERHVNFADGHAIPDINKYPQSGRFGSEDAKYQRAIREDHMPHIQAGMGGHVPQQRTIIREEKQQPPSWANTSHPEPKPIEYFHGSPSCIDVAYHIKDCPICSQFYKNDKAPYMITIIILAIICILLMKKVMNV